MGYDTAFDKAWSELDGLSDKGTHSVAFLSDSYDVDIAQRRVMSLSCSQPARQPTAILLLHYLIRSQRAMPKESGEWISFRQVPGGEGYFPSFKKRAIEPIVRKYGDSPDTLCRLVERFKAKTTDVGDFSVVVSTFEMVPVLITLWRGDEEFGPEANILFDKNITDIFLTEDIAVLGEIVAKSI